MLRMQPLQLIDTCAAEMTEQIPAADITPASATAMRHMCVPSPAAKMSDVLATSADIRAMETVATTVKAEVTADADISTAPATAAEISAVETCGHSCGGNDCDHCPAHPDTAAREDQACRVFTNWYRQPGGHAGHG